jgi:hypothetical protein
MRSWYAVPFAVALAAGCSKPAPSTHVPEDARQAQPTIATSATTAPTASAAPTASGIRPMFVRPGVEDTELKADSLGALRLGARVRLKKRDRALDPEETGHATRVAYGPGQEGEIVRFLHRRSVKADVELDVAVVRWDAQVWYEWDIPLNRMQQGKAYSGDDIDRMNRENGKPVTLGRFEAAAHPETLEWIGGTARAEVAPSKPPSGTPKHSRCEPPLRAVPNSYVVFVRDGDSTQQIADDLKERFKITIRRVWPALASFSAEMTPAQLEQLLKDERLQEVQDNCR